MITYKSDCIARNYTDLTGYPRCTCTLYPVYMYMYVHNSGWKSFHVHVHVVKSHTTFFIIQIDRDSGSKYPRSSDFCNAFKIKEWLTLYMTVLAFAESSAKKSEWLFECLSKQKQTLCVSRFKYAWLQVANASSCLTYGKVHSTCTVHCKCIILYDILSFFDSYCNIRKSEQSNAKHPSV